MRIILIKSKLQLGFEKLTYFIIYLALRVCYSEHVLDEYLEDKLLSRIFYYPYVQDLYI